MITRGVVLDERGKLNNFAIEPKVYVEASPIGFTPDAELLNGRLAIIGLVSLLIFEAITRNGLLGFICGL